LRFAIDLADTLSKKIHKKINSADDKTKDSELKFWYNLCAKNYADAIRDLEQSKKLFKINSDNPRIEVCNCRGRSLQLNPIKSTVSWMRTFNTRMPKT